MKKVYWIEGDGIGPEIWKVARPVLDAAMAHMSESLEWTELLAGEKALAATGELLPQATLKALENAEVAIKGPLGTPVGGGFRSLRRHDPRVFPFPREGRLPQDWYSL